MVARGVGRPHPHLGVLLPAAQGAGRRRSPRPPAHRRSRGRRRPARGRRLAGAGATYREIARDLSQSLGGGTWVKEYSYSDMAVLNAQLQSIVSPRRVRADHEGHRGAALRRAPQHRRPHALTRVRHGLLVALPHGGSPASDNTTATTCPPGPALADRGPRDLGGDRRALEGLPQLGLLSRSRNAIPFRTAKPSQSLLK